MKRMRPFGALLLLVAAIACSPSTEPAQTESTTVTPSAPLPQMGTSTPGHSPASSRTPTVTPTACIAKSFAVTPTPTPVPDYSVPRLTVEMLENGTFFAPTVDEIVTLTNGRYETPSDVVALNGVAFGDLDNDGIEDAAITLLEWVGGTMYYQSIHAVLNRDGEPFQAAYGWNLRDGYVGEMNISNGQIIAEVTAYGRNDPNCCPSLPVVETWQLLSDEHLVLRGYSIAPEGRLQEIEITGPTEVTAVSCSIHIKGNISYAPLKNRLRYSIRKMTDVVAYTNWYSLPEEEDNTVGGTFDIPVDLTMVPGGQYILVSVFAYTQVDMAYPYSLEAMDSVVILVL